MWVLKIIPASWRGGYPQYHTAKTAWVLKIVPASWGGLSTISHCKNSVGIKNHTHIVGGSLLYRNKNSAGTIFNTRTVKFNPRNIAYSNISGVTRIAYCVGVLCSVSASKKNT